MKGIKSAFSGPKRRKMLSLVTASFMVTGTLVFIVPMTMPTVSAYMTPDMGLIWNFDDLVMNSGGAVTGAFPNYQITDPILTIAPTDTIMLMGGEDVTCIPGCVIEVLGTFDGMMGMGATFHSLGTAGQWQGFWVMPSGNFMVSGMNILDAQDGVFADNCMMTNVDNCFITNCFNSGITYNGVMGGPMIGWNTIEACGTGIISMDSSSQIIENTIRWCPADGIMLSGWAGPWLDNNDIYSNGNNGIFCFNLDGASINNNDIYDNVNAGVFVETSFANLMGNRIYGYNATPGSGMAGGNAVHILGPSLNMGTEISGNTIIGGYGDEWMGAGAPNGGHAIWANSYEANAIGWPQLNIYNNPYIAGGDGGINNVNDQIAGNGGDAIRIDGIPDIGDPWTDNEALRITGNGLILGGRGGDNINSATNGSAGDGGYGIRIIDDDFAGSQEISGNTFILGGDGGDNLADDTEFASDWRCGDGGDGIYIQDAWMNVPTEVLDNPHVEGGRGGNSTGTGQMKKAGKGGDGIQFKAVTNATIDPTIAFGGDGGNNTGLNILAGDGGDGILIDAFADRFSVVNILDANGTGGDGGDNYLSGGPIAGGPGTGGDGLEVDGGSMAMSQDSNYTGGKGGDAYGLLDIGGMGGHGAYVWNSSNLMTIQDSLVGGDGGDIYSEDSSGGIGGRGAYIRDSSSFNANIGSIIGGDGGDSRCTGALFTTSWGGNGNWAVSFEGAGTTGFIDGVNPIIGGNGGDVLFDPDGTPGAGYSGLEVNTIDSFTLMNSDIAVGIGGYDWVDSYYESNGEMCTWIGFVTNPITIDGNTVHDAELGGIIISNCIGVLINNEVYNASQDSGGAGITLLDSSPALNINHVHDNSNGIWLGTSSSTITRCTIEDNDLSSFRVELGSSPNIINSTISGSGNEDFYVDTDSHPVCLNTTSDKIVVINDALSDLTMQWFAHVQVVDQFLAPVGGAEVWLNDTFGTNLLNDFTPADGWLRWNVVTEFIETQAARTYYTDHNATAISGLQQGWAQPEPTMDASRDVIIVLGASVYNIFLDQGWNLISLPLIQADDSIDQVLRTIDGQWDFIRIYDPLDPEPWKSNATFKPDQLNDFDTLNQTQGFWIDITTASATLTVTGTEPVTTNIPLYAGWNLVGYPSFLQKQIQIALAGTGYDRPVEGFDISEPYDIKQLPDTYMMKPGEAYWVHVPADTVWAVNNLAPIQNPYPIFGMVYLYDGFAGVYTPMLAGAGCPVEVTWWNWTKSDWTTINTFTNAAGQYSVDLKDYLDGDLVYVNATFNAPYSNNGYNYTYVDIFMGMSMQNVICGVPYELMIVNPPPMAMLINALPFPADYVIVDRDGMLAQGYYTYTDGPLNWFSSDPMFIPPAPAIFDGTMSPTPGQGSDVLVIFTGGIQTIEIYEGGMPGDQYLTPWENFFIDPDSTIPGWFKDWDMIQVIVT